MSERSFRYTIRIQSPKSEQSYTYRYDITVSHAIAIPIKKVVSYHIQQQSADKFSTKI